MLTVILVVIAIGIVIFVHELGHFTLAKLFGVKIETFSLGFGPEWLGFTKQNTRYRVSVIPFGGYVKMSGENPFETENVKPGDFMFLSWWKRIIIAFCGPLMNFLFALGLFMILMYSTGVLYPTNSSKIGIVIKDMPAYTAGLQTGDKIESINNESTASWNDVLNAIEVKKAKTLKFVIKRNEKIISFDIKPVFNKEYSSYMVGIGPEVGLRKLSVFESFWHSIKYLFYMCVMFLKSIFLVITGKLKAEVMGPVGVVHSLGVAAKTGFVDFFNLLGIISINLAFVNLLPLPILDGGHIIVFTFEGIFKKSISKEILQVVYVGGVLFFVDTHDFCNQTGYCKNIFRLI
ncbi:RIP metalloprotease [bacterium]